MSHHQNTTEDVRWNSMVYALSLAADLNADLDAEIAGWLIAGDEHLLVDLGCGAGGMAVAIRSAAGPDARVVAVDGEPALLEATRARAAAAGCLDAVQTIRADLAADIPIPSGSADLIWASAVVHHLSDQQAVLNEMAGRLAPGGRLALSEGGLSSRSLPWDLGVDQPGLELRLEAAQNRWFADMRHDLPGSIQMDYGWPRALRTAGLIEVTSKSFLLDLPVPLSPEAVEHVTGRLRGFLDNDSIAARIGVEDRELLRRLTDPDDLLGKRAAQEMFLLSASTVHVGRRPVGPSTNAG